MSQLSDDQLRALHQLSTFFPTDAPGVETQPVATPTKPQFPAPHKPAPYKLRPRPPESSPATPPSPRLAIQPRYNLRPRAPYAAPVTHADTGRSNQTTSNLCRAINVVFSNNFINGLKMVNDKESQHNHEMGNTHKYFWIGAALAYNNHHDNDVVHNMNEIMHDTITTVVAVASEFNAEEMEDESVNVALGVMKNDSTDGIVLDEFSLIVVPTNDLYLEDLEDNEEVDLDKFEMMETLGFCKRMLDLFKI